MSRNYDLVVIGAGPGGYVAAIRGARLGMKVAVVDRRGIPGGVCLNEGCIPSKALLDSSELFATARDRFSRHGISISVPELDLAVLLRRKDDVIRKLTDGITYLFKKNGIDFFAGTARLNGTGPDGSHQVTVRPVQQQDPPGSGSGDGEVVGLISPRVIVATGSDAVPLPFAPFDGDAVVSAREALSFGGLPEHLVVVGGGYIGLELGSVWRRLGADVTVVEQLPRLLPAMDGQVADALYRSLRKQGLQFRLGTGVTGIQRSGERTVVTVDTGSGAEELPCDRVLVAVGRRPYTAGLGLEQAGVAFDTQGRLAVNQDYETTVPGIFAIGDLVSGPMLAHKASEEGVVCVERMSGRRSVVEYELIPGVCYTWPEAASVGRTEEQLAAAGLPFKSGRFNFSALGRARCMDESEGFVKILAHAETDRILGVHIFGPRASELIAEAATVMGFEGTARDIALMCHAHPTLSEALKEAALDVHKESLHM